MTRRLQILERLGALAALITVANGFPSDAGQHVYIGAAPELSDGDPDEAIAIVPRDDTTTEPNYQHVDLPVEVQAIRKASGADAWIRLEELLGAVKIAIELKDRTLGSVLKEQMQRGPTRSLERPTGSTTIGIGVVYLCKYIEPWGNPAIGVPEES